MAAWGFAVGLVAVTAWAFGAYTAPRMVMDFAALLQLCGIPVR